MSHITAIEEWVIGGYFSMRRIDGRVFAPVSMSQSEVKLLELDVL